jgi:methylamine--corrinoid protein Co-methyltransferase
MEARMACETGLAAVNSKLKRSDVNDIVKKVVREYEDRFDKAPLGKSFPECYNIKSVRPSEEYMELYKEKKKEFEDLGLTYLY